MPRIYETDQSIFAVKSEVLVNPVNCVGVMGAGLARDFAYHYPEILESYKSACKTKRLSPGKTHRVVMSSGKCVVNFPTKYHWRDKSHIGFIASGMRDLVDWLLKSKYKSVAIPRLGCGLGELDWETVRAIVVRELDILPEEYVVWLFEAKNY